MYDIIFNCGTFQKEVEEFNQKRKTQSMFEALHEAVKDLPERAEQPF